jgi:uncharacterized protein YndB with AHSA1/START domain
MAGEDKPTFVYVTYIAAPPEKVWQALTEPDLTEKYWFGFRVRANGKAGERMTARDPARKSTATSSLSASRRGTWSMPGVRSMTNSSMSARRV